MNKFLTLYNNYMRGKMDLAKRIDELRKQRGWTVYRLAIQTGLSQQSIRGWFDAGKSSAPTVATIEILCDAFGISLVEFFTEKETPELTPEIKRMCHNFSALTNEEKIIFDKIIKKINHR